MMQSTQLLIGAGRGFNGLRLEAKDLLGHDNLSNSPNPTTRQLAQDLAMVNGRTLEFQESVTTWLTELIIVLMSAIQDFPLETSERKSSLELLGMKNNKFKKSPDIKLHKPQRGDCPSEENEATDECFAKDSKLPFAIWKRMHGGLEHGSSSASDN